MHIPLKVDYGVRALIDLALHADSQPIRASDIARRTMIPEPFLAQVMHAMGRNGIVRAQRGPQGGHALALKPEEIRLSRVMDSLGSSENLMACLENATSCIHVPSCAQREVWESVEVAVYEILDTRTIADLVVRSRAMTDGEARVSVPREKPSPDPKEANRWEDGMGFVKVGKVGQVPPGTAKVYEVADKSIAVCNVGGKLYAIDDACTHDGGSLDQGDLDGFEIECPRHAARFDVRSGDVTAPPARQPVTTFAVRVQGTDIELDA